MEFWKAVIAPVLVAAIIGVGAFVWGRMTAPDAPLIDAEIQWVDVPNPITGITALIPPDKQVELDKYVQSRTGLTKTSAALLKFQFSPTIRIATLSLRNTTSVRSKPIEIQGPDDSIVFALNTVDALTQYSNRVQIKPLDPDGRTSIQIISSGWSPFDDNPVKILHDDRKVDVKSVIPKTNDLLPFVGWFSQYPALMGLLSLFGILFSVLLLAIVPFGIAMNTSLQFRARMTAKKDAIRQKEFVEYLQANDPEKLKP
jgi:hypothetical protein